MNMDNGARGLRKKFLYIVICISFFIILDIGLRFYLYFKTGNRAYLEFSISFYDLGQKKIPSAAPIGVHSPQHEFEGYYKLTKGKFNLLDKEKFLYTINGLGFRNREFSVKKANGVTRIFALGSSDVFGVFVEDDQTFPYYLQEALKGPEVINAAFCGYRMYNIYNLFKNEVINYQPDMIILYEAYNDTSRIFWNFNDNLLLSIHNFFYNRWMLYTLLLEKYSLIKTKSPVPFFLLSQKMPQEYIEYLKKIISLAMENKIKVVLVKEQMINDIPNDLTLDALTNMYMKTSDIKIRQRILQRFYLKQLEEIGGENGLLVIDLMLEKNDKIFMDINHLNAEGYRLLAENVAKQIKEYFSK